MSSLFKKMRKYTSPHMFMFSTHQEQKADIKDARNEAEQAANNSASAQQAMLKEEEDALTNLRPTLEGKYKGQAKSAGTYADSPEFARGLESDVQAGYRGAAMTLQDRINAIRRRLGMEETAFSETAPSASADLARS
jgi:hypothetical protein